MNGGVAKCSLADQDERDRRRWAAHAEDGLALHEGICPLATSVAPGLSVWAAYGEPERRDPGKPASRTLL